MLFRSGDDLRPAGQSDLVDVVRERIDVYVDTVGVFVPV